MTLVGKILTFLIFIMSMVFMTFTLATYAAHRNWRNEVEGPSGLRAKFDNAKREWTNSNQKLEELALKLERERASRRETLASKESRIKSLTEDFNKADGLYKNMIADHRKSVETANMAQAEMDRMKTELAKVRTHLQDTLADRNSQLLTATETRDSLQETIGKLSLAETSIDELKNSLSEKILEVDQLGTGVGGGRINGVASLDLDGQVTSVRNDTDLVTVSLGSDEGLNQGDTLEVWRSNGAYIGRLVVIETKTDTAVARIVPEYLQGRIRRGDSVGTKLL